MLKIRAIALLGATLVLAACPLNLPVNPLINFRPYPNPYYRQEDFEKQLNAWKAGRSTWQIQFKGTAFSEQELIVNSNQPSSYGPRLAVAGTGGQTFTPTKAELVQLVDRLVASKVFDLYDGHYGSYSQGGGVGGPDLEIKIGAVVKHVSKDEELTTGWEAEAIKAAADAVLLLGQKYIHASGASSPPSSAPSAAPTPSVKISSSPSGSASPRSTASQAPGK